MGSMNKFLEKQGDLIRPYIHCFLCWSFLSSLHNEARSRALILLSDNCVLLFKSAGT